MKAILKAVLVVFILLLISGAALFYSFPKQAFDLVVAVEYWRSGLQNRTLDVAERRWFYFATDDLKPADSTSDSASDSTSSTTEKPLIVFLHGMSGDRNVWARIAAELSSEYRLLAPDLPGFGESARNMQDSYLPTDQLPRLETFLQASGARSFHLVGHGMGAHIAGLYAEQHPEQVHTLTLISAAGVPESLSNTTAQAIGRGEVPVAISSAEQWRSFSRKLFVKPPPIPAPVLKHVVQRLIDNREFNRMIFNQYTPVSRQGLVPALLNQDAPILILWGDQDQIIDITTAEVMQQQLPRAEFKLINNSGHMSIVESAPQVADFISQFIASKQP